MKRILASVLVMGLLLAGCSKPQPTAPVTDPTTVPTTAPTTEPTTAPTTVPTTAPTTVPTEPEETEPTEPPAPEYTNPLTGEALDAPITDRPFAVVLNDDVKALPHWSVSQCQMLWELPHEYGTTRMVAMYTDLTNIDRLGSMRSARPYQISLAMSFNALFVHAGYSSHAKNMLRDTGWETINGVEGKYGYKYFHRDQDRLNAGVALEHTMYTTGPEVLAYCQDMGYTVDAGTTVSYGYQFTPDGTPADGTDASSINITFRRQGKKTNLTYDESLGGYTMEQFKKPYVDANDGHAVVFENVLILKTWVGLQPDSDYRLDVGMTGSGSGYYACGGKMIPITWSCSDSASPFVYTLEDGTPLTLGVGNSYVSVIYNDGGNVTAS